ncbi:MAG: hypothetical protein HOP21_00620 [Methylotenera sp.]|nr:hypothetical protein [Methylotenera sp.]
MFNNCKTYLQKLLPKRKLNAAQLWQQLGREAGSAYWFVAYPVHLVLQRDTFSLASPVPLQVEAAEAIALTDALNTHFNEDGVEFFWQDEYWFLKLKAHPNIHNFSPQQALNQDISRFLPTGAGARAWAAFQNEVQMLLFTHAVNQARDVRHLPIINSIWCDNGGQFESTHAN